MDKAFFTNRLQEVSVIDRDFAARFVSNYLPDSCRYLVRLNQSCDGNLKPDEHVFPDDTIRYGDCVGPLTSDEVANLLCRDKLVPEWIDISVKRADSEHTYFELLCCGRFTADDSLLYYRDGHAPFGIKSPAFPPHWSEEQGRFDLDSRRA